MKGLIIDRVDVPLPQQFVGLHDVRILHCSDLHLSGANRKIEYFFDNLGSIESEIAIISGDLIDTERGISVCIDCLSKLKAKYGIYISLGNHDRYRLGLKEFLFYHWSKKISMNNIDHFFAQLLNRGMTVLFNEIRLIAINGVGVDLIGIEAPLGYDRFKGQGLFRQALQRLDSVVDKAHTNNFSILISHIPDLIQGLNLNKINLILSSHTHGGQIRLPWVGPLFTNSKFQRKYCQGIFKYNDAYLHISTGLGVSAITPFRLMSPPRATVISLKRLHA